MIQPNRGAAIAALTLFLAASTAAQDAGRSFDCDGPYGKTFERAFPTTLPVTISGVLQAIEIRHGSYLPSAGAAIASADGKKGIMIDFEVNAYGARELIPSAYGTAGSPLPIPFPKVPRYDPVAFSLSLSPSGKAIVRVGQKTIGFQAKPMESAKIALYCDTGKFKFSELNVSTSP
jgi:hypothetical protein